MPSILIVDDNRDAADLLGAALDTLGHRVCVVYSALEALEVLDEAAPDAALLDIGLPILDGYELARKLLVRRPNLCLIAITGYGQAHDRERAFEAGFHAHFVKPVSLPDLTAALDRYCFSGNAPSRE